VSGRIDKQRSENSSLIEIREMRRDELDFAIALAAGEGWNPGLQDAKCFYHADPHGFFLGLLNDKPIGCISAVSYDGVFGFIGFYIIMPEHRGKGCGIALWRRAMQRLEGHNIGLDGVIAQQSKYKQSGFSLAYRNIRYRGNNFPKPAVYKHIVPLNRFEFGELVAFDSRFFPTSRPRFLQEWARMPDSLALAFVRNDRLAGYGVIRRCQQGFKVGPLFADNEMIADQILLGLSERVPAPEPIFLDVPEANPLAVSLAHRYRMAKIFETARMYTGNFPKLEINGVFGVTTFELG
jgi:GNAT superfamily N-acetyltransferase